MVQWFFIYIYIYIYLSEHPKAESLVVPENPRIEPTLITLFYYITQLRYNALTPVGNKMYCTLSAQALYSKNQY